MPPRSSDPMAPARQLVKPLIHHTFMIIYEIPFLNPQQMKNSAIDIFHFSEPGICEPQPSPPPPARKPFIFPSSKTNALNFFKSRGPHIREHVFPYFFIFLTYSYFFIIIFFTFPSYFLNLLSLRTYTGGGGESPPALFMITSYFLF